MIYATELILIPEEDGSVTVWNPDLDVWSAGDSDADAACMGADAVHGTLVALSQLGRPIPEPLSASYEMPENATRAYASVYWEADEPEEEFITGREAADLLGVSRQAVSALAKSGALRSKKVGRTLLVATADVRDRANRRSAAPRLNAGA